MSLTGIVKIFGGTRAVDGVDFSILPGEVHALLGGNGAGKSTLIKCLAGVHRPNAGRIELAGREVDPQAERLPIAFIHQDLALVPSMSVAENVALLAGFPRRRALINWSAVSAQARRALDILGASIDPDARIADLSQADKSIVAIARALATDAEAIVLDEPTASLPEAEVARLFTALRRLRTSGRGMVYVSHRLDEIFRISDRVTVMRDGKLVATAPTAETTPDQLVSWIVGRAVHKPSSRPERGQGTLLSLDGGRVAGVGPVDFDLAPGEILGFAGLRGAGHEALGRAVAGIIPLTAGAMTLGTTPIRPRTPVDSVRAGIAFVSSRRQEESLALPLAVRENLFINPEAEGRFAFSPLARSPEAARALTRLRAVGARPLVTEPAIHTFSGGNQQKVVLARWLSGRMRVLVLEEPTMGVDVGAKADIYALLDGHARAGGAVIVVSSDLEEVASVCHRALIFDRGRVSDELSGAALTVPALVARVGGQPAKELARA